MSDVTAEDWGKIHAKAWRDPGFKYLLETNPTEAVKQYGKEVGKTFTKIVDVREPPKNADTIPPELLDQFNPFAPSCC